MADRKKENTGVDDIDEFGNKMSSSSSFLSDVVFDDDCSEEDYDDDELVISFNGACERLKNYVGYANQTQLLEFYSYYKQATVGPCDIPRPGWFAMEAKRKWDAWNGLGKMTKEEAMIKYVETLNKFVKEVGEKEGNSLKDREKIVSGGKSKKLGWVSVSSMINPNEDDEEISDEKKTIFDWVKESNLEKLKQLLSKDASGRTREEYNAEITSKDDGGMGLIHWAADRGDLDIIKFLISDLKATDLIDMKDADGQTPLHYAASCGHYSVLKFLIDNGSDIACKDNDGCTPVDVAADSESEKLLLGN